MSDKSITMVRIYLTEGDHQLKELLAHLHDVEKVSGVTAFRGIAGFGRSGKMHSSDLLDLSLNMPLVIEFFDEQQKVESVLQRLDSMIEPGHIVSWPANLR
ncbi:MAG: DUF190 domain-containing protein [Candidatus Polarisedimenticolaceae bacterium]|nr:DUF190 domain-containing protein [Candidatus Polarisedimenticolaceae bacterium]